jgi:MFS family permease
MPAARLSWWNRPSAISSRSVLRNRNLSFYLSARFLGTLAVQMQSVAVGWQVYQITGSLFDLGLIGLAQFAPFLVLILWAGHVADRTTAATIIALCMCHPAAVQPAAGGLHRCPAAVVWPVFAVLVLFGSARAFMMPASQAVLRNLVPPRFAGRRAQLVDLPRGRDRRPGAGRPAVRVRAERVYDLSSVPCWRCRCC